MTQFTGPRFGRFSSPSSTSAPTAYPSLRNVSHRIPTRSGAVVPADSDVPDDAVPGDAAPGVASG